MHKTDELESLVHEFGGEEHDQQQLYPALRKAQQSSAKQEPFTNISRICIEDEINVRKLTFRIIDF